MKFVESSSDGSEDSDSDDEDDYLMRKASLIYSKMATRKSKLI